MRRALIVALLVALPATAGQIGIAWDPVTHPDLAGYRIFIGTEPGVYTLMPVDVGTTTWANVPSLTDCTGYFIAVKSRDAAGNVSSTYSNEVAGWPDIRLTAQPTVLDVGRTYALPLTGANWRTGATVTLLPPVSGTAIPGTLAVTDCTRATATFTIPADAPLGLRVLKITNPDRTYLESSGVFSIGDTPPPAPNDCRRISQM